MRCLAARLLLLAAPALCGAASPDDRPLFGWIDEPYEWLHGGDFNFSRCAALPGVEWSPDPLARFRWGADANISALQVCRVAHGVVSSFTTCCRLKINTTTTKLPPKDQ